MAHGGYGVLPTSKRGAEDKRGGAIEHHDNAHSSGARMSYKRIFYLDPHRTFSSPCSWFGFTGFWFVSNPSQDKNVGPVRAGFERFLTA